MGGFSLTNPLLDAIKAARPDLTNPAPQTPPILNPGTASPQFSAIRAQTVKQPEQAPPPQIPPMNAPSVAPIKAPQPSVGPPVTHPTGTLQGDKDYREYLNATGSGISQIKQPFLRGAARTADIIGGLVAPGLMRAIPGTEEHHQFLLGNANKALTQDEASAEKQAQMAAQQAEVPLRQAQTEEAQVRAKNLPAQLEASLAEHGYRMGEDGKLEQIPEAELSAVQQAQVEAAKNPWMKEAGNQPLGANVDQLNKAMEGRYQVTDPGKPLPPELTLPKNATKADFDRLDKLMEAREKAAQGNKTAVQAEADRQASLGIRNAMLALATQRESKGEGKQDFTEKQAALKTFTPAMDSAERFNVMTESYEKAVKNHDQQAMLNLLANHLGMTMGLQKGARMTKDIINEAQKSQPWLQGIAAKFDKDGYLSGVTLSPLQMRQMVDLGQSRYAEDTKKARSEAQYIGIQNDGPDRVPGKATMRFYLGQTNGDVNKAKQLATDDGWTVSPGK